MTAEHLEIGAKGEELAVEFLKAKKYSILGRNYKTKFGEIDIIARKSGVLIFVEVKTMVFGGSLRPEDNLHGHKQARILKSSKIYMMENKLTDVPWQIDLLAIDVNEDGEKKEIRHMESVIWG
jgi:putative endonuclease